MSGFYGQLAKEALGDDVSDVSDGELENMLANMDDLDAGLFGSGMPKPTTGTNPAASKQATTATAIKTIDTKPLPISVGKSKKSELLAELFGAEEEQTDEPSLSFQQEPMSGRYPPKSISPVFKFDSLTNKTAEEKGALNVQDYNQVPTEPYVPMLSAGERRKRTVVRSKPIEDLWGDFLQPDSVEPKSVEANIFPETSSLEFKPTVTTLVPKLEKSAEIRGSSFQNLPPPKSINAQQLNAAKFELTEEIKEKILSMIKKEQEINNKAQEENFETRLVELGSENATLREEIDNLKLQSSQHDSLIEELNKTIVENEERADKMMNDWCTDIGRNLQDVQSQNRERVSDIMCQVSQFEEQLRDLQHLADSLQPAQVALKEKMTNMQKNHEAQIASYEDNLESLRETNAEDNRKLKKSIEEKLFKITREIGDCEIVEKKLDVLEERLKKLISRNGDSRYEAEVVQRLEISESGMLQKINYCSNQQVRQESWHHQQLNDLSEHTEQRLRGLHRHVELTVSSVKSDVEMVRKDVTNRLGDMENKVVSAENETCRLSRLAERLCGLLQLWEMRNKESSKIQEVMEQSFRERYALAMEEKQSHDRASNVSNNKTFKWQSAFDS